MRQDFLLPTRYKTIGMVLAIPAMAVGALLIFDVYDFPFLNAAWRGDSFLDGKNENFTDEITLTLSIIGLLMIAFAREKSEDEYIRSLRLESLQWAVLINYALLLITTWLVYGLEFLNVMIYNMLTVLLIFILRFHYVLRRSNSSTSN
jgi:hypothetical protein